MALIGTFAPLARAQDVSAGVDGTWLAASKDAGVPANAAVAGEEPAKHYEKGSEPAKVYYACRATVRGSVRAGKAAPGGVCELPGAEDAESFEVLEGASDLEWEAWRSDNGRPLPALRVTAGFGAGDAGVCRATAVCRFRKPNGVCTIEGRHPGTLEVGPDGIARCKIAHRAFGDCTCYEFDVLTAPTRATP
jgi:hypothetical protein